MPRAFGFLVFSCRCASSNNVRLLAVSARRLASAFLSSSTSSWCAVRGARGAALGRGSRERECTWGACVLRRWRHRHRRYCCSLTAFDPGCAWCSTARAILRLRNSDRARHSDGARRRAGKGVLLSGAAPMPMPIAAAAAAVLAPTLPSLPLIGRAPAAAAAANVLLVGGRASPAAVLLAVDVVAVVVAVASCSAAAGKQLGSLGTRARLGEGPGVGDPLAGDR